MLLDSIELTAGSTVAGLKFPAGATLPAAPEAFMVFTLTATDGAFAPGNYQYRDGVWNALSSAVPYDIAAPTFGKPAASEVVMRLTTQRAFSVQSAAAKATTAATVSTAVFTVAKNGAPIGTLTFAVSGTVATSTVPVTAFAVNDVLTITAPGTQNATLADIDFFVKGQVA